MVRPSLKAWRRVSAATRKVELETTKVPAPGDRDPREVQGAVARFRVRKEIELHTPGVGVMLRRTDIADPNDTNPEYLWEEIGNLEKILISSNSSRNNIIAKGCEVTAVFCEGVGWMVIDCPLFGFNADTNNTRPIVSYGAYQGSLGYEKYPGTIGMDVSRSPLNTYFTGEVEPEREQIQRLKELGYNDLDFVQDSNGNSILKLYPLYKPPCWAAYAERQEGDTRHVGLDDVEPKPQVGQYWGLDFDYDKTIGPSPKLVRKHRVVTLFWWKFQPEELVEPGTGSGTADPTPPGPVYWIAPHEWWRITPQYGYGFSRVMFDRFGETVFDGYEYTDYVYYGFGTTTGYESAYYPYIYGSYWGGLYGYYGYGYWAGVFGSGIFGEEKGRGSLPNGEIDEFAPIPSDLDVTMRLGDGDPDSSQSWEWRGTLTRECIFVRVYNRNGWRVLSVNEDEKRIFIDETYRWFTQTELVNQYSDCSEGRSSPTTSPPTPPTLPPTTSPPTTPPPTTSPTTSSPPSS